MKQQNTQDLLQSKKDLQYLQQQQLIPPQIKYKLRYLQAILDNAYLSDHITQQISQNQRISLQNMPKETQISIFISTIRCLSGKQIIVYITNQKVYLYLQKNFFKWQKCYLSCTSNVISLIKSTKNPEILNKFDINKIFISKSYKLYKKKNIFGIYNDQVKYILGFDQQKTCQRIHSIIYKLVKQKRQIKYSKYNKQDQKIINTIGLQSKKVQQYINDQEFEYLQTIQERINTFDIGSQQSFKLVKNVQNGRILQDHNTSYIKINMIVKSLDPCQICQSYLKMPAWNKQITSFKVISKIRTNSFICHMKTSKYSYLSYPRQCYLSVIFYSDKQNQNNQIKTYYLLLQSVQWQQKQQSSSVLMDFKQILQIKVDDIKQTTLLNICTKANFKGYCNNTDNSNMILHLFNDISNLNQQLSKNQQKQFQFTLNRTKRNIDIFSTQKDLSLPTDRSSISQQFQQNQQKSQYNMNHTLKKQGNTIKQTVLTDKTIINTIFTCLKNQKDENMIDIIRNKRYYNYYLKHRFNQKQEVYKVCQVVHKDFFLQNNRWKLQNQQYIFIDKTVLNNQKDIIKMILKQAGQNLMAGKSIMNMSLPVQIFDTKSLLQSFTDSLGFLPYYLQKIKKNDDPIEQMKLITSAFTYIHFVNANIEKPFNPILGQTFQGKIGDIMVYLQQISHHPPISAMYAKSNDIQIYGSWQINISMGLNSGTSVISNFIHVNLPIKKRSYVINHGNLQFGGLAYGSRTWRLTQKSFVYQKTQSLFSQLSCGKYKKKVYQASTKLNQCDLTGAIFKVTKQFGQKYLSFNHKKGFSGVKPEDILKTYSFIQGKIYGDLYFDKILYKSIKQGPFPQRIFKNHYLLPSDSIFRQDVIYRRWQQYDNSNSAKQKLQNIQRMDRKLRQKYKKQVKSV